jgi:glycosyltransferase involved in cell wall biosynthesis
MKVIHFVTTLDVGGAEMHLLQQVRGQTARGVQCTVAYMKGEGALRADFERAGAVVLAVQGVRGWWRFVQALRQHDVIHTHLLKADAVGALLALGLGLRSKLIASKHNDERALLNPWVARVHGVLGNLPQRTIVLSDHVGRFVAEHGRVDPRRIVRVYYGLDTTAFEAAQAQRQVHRTRVRTELGSAAGDFVYICIARFAAQKAHDVLLRAFADAHAREPRLRLWLRWGVACPKAARPRLTVPSGALMITPFPSSCSWPPQSSVVMCWMSAGEVPIAIAARASIFLHLGQWLRTMCKS